MEGNYTPMEIVLLGTSCRLSASADNPECMMRARVGESRAKACSPGRATSVSA